jgi:hypothetical protein
MHTISGCKPMDRTSRFSHSMPNREGAGESEVLLVVLVGIGRGCKYERDL